MGEGKSEFSVRGNGIKGVVQANTIQHLNLTTHVHISESPQTSSPAPAEDDPAPERPPLEQEPAPHVNPLDFIRPGGAVDVDSRFYVRRKADNEVLEGVNGHRGMVTVQGPRQTGKTSLILRVYVGAQRPDSRLRAVFVDFQALERQRFETLSTIWQTILKEMDSQLGGQGWNEESWDPKANYDRNVSQFLDRFIFAENETPVLICLDEVDKVFSSPIRSDFFSSIRHFYNRGAFDRAWKNVRWILSTSSEPGFFIEDLNQSPFNIGLKVKLRAFISEETAEFARLLGLSLDSATINTIMKYVGGRPYLVHLLLYHMALKPDAANRLFDASSCGGGVFEDHLKRYLTRFQEDSGLTSAMKLVIAGSGCKNDRIADRLESAGLVRRDANQNVVCACKLYMDYFRAKL